MWNKWFAKGAILAGISVALGAFAAHGLKAYVDSGKMELQSLMNFDTGARYQMYHSLALIACALLMKVMGETKLLKISAWLFSIGIVLFSGSLYLLSTRAILGIESWTFLGPITPVGGLCFLGGWLLMGIAVFRIPKNPA